MNKRADDADERDAPLPGTLVFVLTLGSLYFVGWFLMFWLLKERF